MAGVIVAILSGIIMAVQGVFNTGVTKQSSLWTTAAFVHLTAFLVCIAAWMLTDRGSFGRVIHAKPAYMLLGGTIGAFITYTVVVSMGQLGPAHATLLIVTAQIVCAYLIEVLGLFGTERTPISFREIAGIVIAVIGIIIFKMKGSGV